MFPSFYGNVLLSCVSTGMLTCSIDIGIVSVCLSVHPSVTLQYCLHPSIRLSRSSIVSKQCKIIMHPLAHCSPVAVIFSILNIFAKFRRGHLYGRIEYSVAYKFCDFQPTSRYMWETIQDRVIPTMER